MASTDYDTFGNAPYLNSNEQNLLLNALKSNKGDTAESSNDTLNPDLTQLAPDSTFFDPSLLDEDFTNDFTWDLNGGALADVHDDNAGSSAHSADGDELSPASQTDGKRKEHPDDEEDGTPGKRRESEEKVAKKPGRKPLTSEPTSKRKAQNRAAQRAFRERKEKHLRDLETKVEDLEKASEATNHENGMLRAQVDKLNAQLAEYKKRLSSTASPSGYSPNSSSNRMNWDIGSNLNFEFPNNFGMDANDKSKTATKAKECVNSLQALRALDDLERSSAEQSFYRSAKASGFNNSPSPFSSGRAMSTSNSISGSTYYPAGGKPTRSPTDSTDKSGSNFASPASLGLGSSCVTTPEASADSPQNKSNDATSLEQGASPGQPKTPGQDALPGFDWFATQNKGLFDPILFGDYREPQDAILNQDLGLGAFDDDTFPWNLDSNVSGIWPANEPLEPALPPKQTLMEQVEKAAYGNDHIQNVMKEASIDSKSQLTCAKLWDRVQRSEKVLSGEADMDDLCSQLKAKAKCGGPNKGAVVDEKDVDAILGPDPAKNKPTGMWGMFS